MGQQDLFAFLEAQFEETEDQIESFWDWIREGVQQGWITTPFCQTHNPTPVTKWEARQMRQGKKPCLVGVRVLWLSDGPTGG